MKRLLAFVVVFLVLGFVIAATTDPPTREEFDALTARVSALEAVVFPTPSPSPEPSPNPSPSVEPSQSPSPAAPLCEGVQVPAGADLRVVIPNGVAETYCLAAGTYELGTASLGYDSGDVIVGQPVTFGPNGGVSAPTALHGTSTTSGVIAGLTGKPNLTVDSLDISGAYYGIDAGAGKIVTLIVRNSRIHGNTSRGIGNGPGRGLNVDHSELDHNGSFENGLSSGIKTVHYAVVTNSYFHDNNGNGMWWDCDAPGGRFENNISDNNAFSGVFVEISSGDSGSGKTIPAGETFGFTINNSHVEGNGFGQPFPGSRAGISLVDSNNVTVDGNTSINNNNTDIKVINDSRQNNAHNGCSSGFPASNVLVQNNQYGPTDLQGCSLGGVVCVNNIKIL